MPGLEQAVVDLSMTVRDAELIEFNALSNDAIIWLAEEMVEYGELEQDPENPVRFYMRTYSNFTLDDIVKKLNEYAVEFELTEHTDLIQANPTALDWVRHPVFWMGFGVGLLVGAIWRKD